MIYGSGEFHARCKACGATLSVAWIEAPWRSQNKGIVWRGKVIVKPCKQCVRIATRKALGLLRGDRINKILFRRFKPIAEW